MIPIRKGSEPPELQRLRLRAKKLGLSPSRAYRTLGGDAKRRVREQLLHEQGQLCAYCMSRIPREDVEPNIVPIGIEHYLPQHPVDALDVGQGLAYENLLAVCHGNKGTAGTRCFADLTCDAHRRNTPLRKVNPCDASSLASIYYTVDGRICAEDREVHLDLVETLNLNSRSSPLVGERRAALAVLLEEMGQVPEAELADYCALRLAELSADEDPKLPYVGILLWYLQSMLVSLT